MADHPNQLLKRALDGKMSFLQRKGLQARSENWTSGLLVLLFCFLMAIVFIVGVRVFDSDLNDWLQVVIILIGGTGVGLVANLLFRWHNRKTASRIMARLSEMGIRPHLCLNCEYDLKGSTSEQCPECGTALAPVDTMDED